MKIQWITNGPVLLLLAMCCSQAYCQDGQRISAEIPNAVLFVHRLKRNVEIIGLYENRIERAILFQNVRTFDISQSGSYLMKNNDKEYSMGNLIEPNSRESIPDDDFPYSYKYVRMSNDGRFLLYFSSSTMILQDIQTQKYGEIFSNPFGIIHPVLSPDDSMLAYYSAAQDTDIFETVLNVLDLKTYENRVLSRPSSAGSISGVVQNLPVWSMDSQRILFESFSGMYPAQKKEWSSLRNSYFSMVNVDGSNCERVFPGIFNSDGSEVLVNDFYTSPLEAQVDSKVICLSKKGRTVKKLEDKLPSDVFIKGIDPTDRYLLLRDQTEYFIYDRTRKELIGLGVDYDFFHHFYWLDDDLIDDLYVLENTPAP